MHVKDSRNHDHHNEKNSHRDIHVIGFNHHPPPSALASDSTGCITAAVQAIEDPAVSVYAGGNMKINGLWESEGSMIIGGNLVNEGGISLAGKVMWGMGYQPPANATMLAVGGNITSAVDSFASGNIRVGGTVTGNLQLANEKTIRALLVKWGINPDASSDGGMTPLQSYMRWAYENQKNAKTLTKLGKTNALKVDMDGDGTLESDFNDHVNKSLKPLSNQLRATPTTGRITYEKAPDIPNYGFVSMAAGEQYMSITKEGKIVFTGDGQKHRQVFNLNTTELDAAKTRLGVRQWSLDFENIPDGQAIVVNVTTPDSYAWIPGWRIWINGVNRTTYVNSSGDSLNRYRDAASRIMWNFPNTKNLTLKNAYYDAVKGSTSGLDQQEKSSSGVLFPGSILLPNGKLTVFADTNGRLLVGGDMEWKVWEHHNLAWIGFDEPQCFAISGRTAALLR
ncbi:choice-of-anchor A family protein [Bifidobacterium sp. SO1]|uniref:choice-of-anchor A family protein n=1 Tax=Bifidobacterium sp. SO1 TaxID=2809029 RepID=UPI001BDC91C0|nr:choice-of-anchor A family protein [Bifidobacterium sp. SO1]MBT1162747.1 choice-of-anchor A family protein [Bifidobacterium sp. SO1]